MGMMAIGVRSFTLDRHPMSPMSDTGFSVSIRVGTPPQWLDVFVSTASEETWVIGPGGCDGSKFCHFHLLYRGRNVGGFSPTPP